MENRMKMGAAALTLAVLISGCAPVPGATPQAGATGDYNTYGTTGSSTNYGYGTGTTGTAATTGTNTNTSYYDYGAGSAATTTTPGYDYSSGYGTGTTTSGSSYYNYTAPATGGTATNPVGGAYAVQVVASPNRSTADAMVSQMQSMGFNAVVDQVGGYYKVRVPFNSESEAKANLGRIRSSGAADAFYTVR